MNNMRMTAITAKFFNDVAEELVRAIAKFPTNKHRMGALHEEVGEVAKAMLERDYGHTSAEPHNDTLDNDVYKECVQAAAMALRVATEGDPDYLYQNPHYRAMDTTSNPPSDEDITRPNPDEALEITIRDVSVQVDSDGKSVKLTHQPTGLFCHCGDYNTQQRNEAGALKQLNSLVREHLSWGTKDDGGSLSIPTFLRRGSD